MKTVKDRYITPESELYMVAIEASILSGEKGKKVVFGPDEYSGNDPDLYYEGGF